MPVKFRSSDLHLESRLTLLAPPSAKPWLAGLGRRRAVFFCVCVCVFRWLRQKTANRINVVIRCSSG